MDIYKLLEQYPGKDYRPKEPIPVREWAEGEWEALEERCIPFEGGTGYFGRSMSGEKHPMWGRTHTPESRKLISENHADVSGENNPMYGRGHTEESRKKISESKQGKKMGPMSESHKKSLSEAKKVYWTKNKAKRTKQLLIEGKVYKDAFEASKEYGIHPVNVRRRCRLEQYPDWNYL